MRTAPGRAIGGSQQRRAARTRLRPPPIEFAYKTMLPAGKSILIFD
jgi:hypothetical protein